MIRLVLSDIDETLMAYGRSHVSKRALDAIEAAQKAGVVFAPLSGRTYLGIKNAFDGHEFAYRTSALTNGQIVFADGELLLTRELDHAALERVAEVIKDDPRYCFNIILDAHTPTPTHVIVTTQKDVVVWRQAEGIAPHVMSELPQEPIVKANITVLAGTQGVEELGKKLSPLAPEFDFFSPGAKIALLDLAPHGWDKAQGARVLAEHFGIAPHEVAVFGDAQNDLPSLKAFPNSVAVANAIPQFKEAARWHIGQSKDDAVALAIEDIARAAKTGELPSFMQE